MDIFWFSDVDILLAYVIGFTCQGPKCKVYGFQFERGLERLERNVLMRIAECSCDVYCVRNLEQSTWLPHGFHPNVILVYVLVILC